MSLLGDHQAVATYSPMPVNDMTNSTDIVTVSAEAVTIAAGAAGTSVAMAIDKAPIYNSTGVRIGNENDTSFAWVTGTTFTTEVGINYRGLESLHAGKSTAAATLTAMTADLANGEYVVDYENGVIYGVKADAGVADTANYLTRAYTVVVTTTGTITATGSAAANDDSAFTVGSGLVTTAGFLADETAPDSVNEGDVGAARMTLDRKQLTASEQILGTATYTEAATYGGVVGAVRNDALASLVDTDNEIAPLQVDANGALYVVTSGTGAGQFAEDTAHNTADIGNFMLAVRNDTLASLVDTDGDYAPLQVNDLGALFVDVAEFAGNPIDLGAGAVAVGTQRTTLASDDPAVAALEIMDDWDAVHDSAVSSDGPQVMAEAANFDGAALPNAVAEGDAVRPKASLQGVQYVMLVNEDGSSQPAYDTGTDSNKSFEVSPLSTHHVEETLADVTNGTDATYSYYVDMDGYRNFALQTTISGGSGTATMTIEATLQDDGTAAASCTYVDVTTALFGAASYTASGYHIVDTSVPIKYLKVQIVASTGGANDADWTLYFKKQW